jgi:hypothetical protein
VQTNQREIAMFLSKGKIFSTGLAACLFALAANAAAPSVASGLVGTWRLESRRDITADGKTQIEPSLGEHPLAMLIYDAQGNVAVQLMKRDRSVASDSSPSAQNSGGSNSSSGTGSYDAYFGTYVVDPKSSTVTHHVDAALSPGDVGRTFTRHIELKGDLLTLSFKTTVGNGQNVTRVLVWRKAS